MNNLIVAVNCVAPVFIIICVGILIRHSKIVPDQIFPQISSIVFNFLLPCMLFHSIYTTDLNTAFDLQLLLYLVAFLLIWFAVGFALSTRFVPDHRARGAIIQSFFRSNIAIVGISMANSAMGSAGVASMSMAVAVLVPIYNVLGVVALETCRGGAVQLRPTLIAIAKNPLILSCILGIAFLLSGIKLPSSVVGTIGNIGTAGSVMSLIALGASFQLGGVRKNMKRIVFASLLRLVITPFAALLIAFLLGFRGNDLGIILLCAASPLATTSFPMSIACGSDHELTGQLVVITSFFCCFTLFLWIFFLKQTGLL